MKTLKDILELYQAKSKDERRFVDKHIVVKQKDRNGNKDNVFQATNIKAVDRKAERHGYEPGEDEEVYEQAKWRQNPTEVLDESYNEMKSDYNKWADAHAGNGGTPDTKTAAKHQQNITSKYGKETFRHFQKALRANMNQKYDKEESHLDDAFQFASSERGK